MTNANVNPVDCGSKDAQTGNSVRASEALPHGVRAVPIALHIGTMNRVETADDENHATDVQPDEVTERRRVDVHNR